MNKQEKKQRLDGLQSRYNDVIEDVVKVCNERIIGLGNPAKLSDEGLLLNFEGFNDMLESVKKLGGGEIKQLKNNVQVLNMRLDSVRKYRKARGQEFPFSGVDDKRAKVMNKEKNIAKFEAEDIGSEKQRAEQVLSLLKPRIEKYLSIELNGDNLFKFQEAYQDLNGDFSDSLEILGSDHPGVIELDKLLGDFFKRLDKYEKIMQVEQTNMFEEEILPDEEPSEVVDPNQNEQDKEYIKIKKDIQKDKGYFTNYGELLNNDTWMVDRINGASISDEQKMELINEYNLFRQKTNYDRLIGIKGICDQLKTFEYGVSEQDLTKVNELVKDSIQTYENIQGSEFKDDPLAIRLIFLINKVLRQFFKRISSLIEYSSNSQDFGLILGIIQNSELSFKLKNLLIKNLNAKFPKGDQRLDINHDLFKMFDDDKDTEGVKEGLESEGFEDLDEEKEQTKIQLERDVREKIGAFKANLDLEIRNDDDYQRLLKLYNDARRLLRGDVDE